MSRFKGGSLGMTIIELLLVLALMGVVLVVLTAFFRQQTDVSSGIQARNEVEGKLRSVAEIMMQDLQAAGSRAVYNGTSVTYIDLNTSIEPSDPTSSEWDTWKSEQCSGLHRDGCVVVDRSGIDLSIYYATSLDRGSGSACRRVDYFLDPNDDLFRRDVDCTDTTTGFSGYLFASGIEEIRVEFICHDPDNVELDISACYSATTYPREASVTVTGRSEGARNQVTSSVRLATSLPNLRPPVDYLDL